MTQSQPIRAEVRATLALATPLAAANVAQMVMGLTNTIMVGHLGGNALGAAGLGGGLYFTLVIICRSVLAAVAPLAAHAIGAGNQRDAGLIAGAGLALGALVALPVIAVLSVLDRFLVTIGYDPALAAEVGRYLEAIRWGAPAFLAFEVLRALFAATSRARIVMLALFLGIPANAALNWALIFGHLGAPALGITGAGCATAIVQWTMSLGLGLYLLFLPSQTPLRVSRAVGSKMLSILRLGLPIGGLVALEVTLFATAGIVVGLLGSDALGAHQLVLNFASLTFMVPLGLGQAATVRIGYEIGAGSPERARRAGLVALAIGALVMGVTGVFIWTAPRLITGLYIDAADPANAGLVAIALQLLRIAALFQILDGTQVVAAGALRGYRDTVWPMAIAAFGYWGVGFAGGWVLAFPFGRGAEGLWWGLALGLAVVASLLTARFLWRARSAIRQESNAAASASLSLSAAS